MKSGKLITFLLIGLACAAVFYYVFWPDLAKYLGMTSQNRFLSERITEEENKNIHLKKEQESLSQDPVQIEKVAREKLGLSRPREIIYKFEDETAAPSPAVSAPQPEVGKSK